ncbi:MAG: hypothetical protein HYR85_09695 [Planctomycetes bacterium]|nr:hypothetical protein [Planctomycetota bacterium]MBI3847966.1 hypothetical protein [Planctomycetota bacterium]
MAVSAMDDRGAGDVRDPSLRRRPVRSRLFRPLDVTGRGVAAGIDLGASALRAVLVKRIGPGSKPAVVATLEIPFPVSTPGSKVPAMKEAALREAAGRLGLARRDVAVALGGADVDADLVALDGVPQRERSDAIRWKLRKRGPANAAAGDPVAFRFERKAPSGPEGELATLYLGVAAGEAALADRTRLLEQASIPRHRFCPDVIAMEALLRRAGEIEGTDPVALLYLGDASSTLLVFSGRGFELRHSLRLGVADLERALTEPISLETGVVHLDADQAILALRQLDVGGDGSVPVPLRDPVPSAVLQALVRPHLERLEGDLEKSLRLFDRTSNLAACDRVRITGPGAEVPGIDLWLGERLGMDVQLLDPAAGLALPAKAGDGPDRAYFRFALAIGATLDEPGSLDLVPASVHRARALDVARFAARRTAFFVVLLLGVLAAIRSVDCRRARAELQGARDRLAALRPALDQVRECQRVSSSALRTESVLRVAAPKEWSALGILGDVVRAMPESAFVDEIGIQALEQPPKLFVHGRLLADSTEKAVADSDALSTALDASPFFHDVDVSLPETPSEGAVASDFAVRAIPTILPRRL